MQDALRKAKVFLEKRLQGRQHDLGSSVHSREVNADESPFLHFVPPGHFYSPLPDLAELMARREILFRRDLKVCPGVDVREQAQLALLEQLSVFYEELPFPETVGTATRYCYVNDFFNHGDAIILYAMLRYYRPRQVVEVGSGFSSAVMLDVNDLFLDQSVRFTFIDPYPDRLLQLFRGDDQQTHRVIQQSVQDVPSDVFRSCTADDIVFIDSSHVVKVGSDVGHILFYILPELQPGVIIHFHDILWPFEYPEEWVLEGRAWNEAYALRAFLQFNDVFEILYFNSYMGFHHADILYEKMPLFMTNPGGSLWLRKVK